MPDLYTEKLDLILARLDAIEAKLAAAPQTPAPDAGLFRFVRPAVRETGRWPADVDMVAPDPEEVFQRALHGVNWRGGAVSDQTYEEAWQEIEALKAGDEKLIAVYREAGLDPEFAGVALLTGLISPAKHDAMSFGVNFGVRRGYAGYTTASFIEAQLSIKGTPGVA